MKGPKFEAFDCFQRRIYCSKDVWYRKLLVYHGIKDKDEALAKRALSQPEGGCPRYDREYPKRRVYYRKDKNEYLKVVVEFRRDSEAMVYGSVITAYFEKRIREDEKPEEKNDESF